MAVIRDVSAEVARRDASAAPDADAIYERALSAVLGAAALDISLGTAESCTGGLVAASLTAVPGSSEAFSGSVVSYAPSVKSGVLGVPASIIEDHGVVSAECAAAMAEGLRGLVGCDVAVSVTGIAGPSGAEEGKPVGTVWFAVATGDATVCELHRFGGDRDSVRAHATFRALVLLCGGIEESSVRAGSAKVTRAVGGSNAAMPCR